MYFDCSPYEDGEMYLTADVSIKCEGPDAGSYIASLGYVSFMSALFAVGIPLYYVLALKEVRHAIMPPLQSILKDRDYVAAFALGGLRLLDEEGTEMKGTQLRSAQQVAKQKWVRLNPELAATLDGIDFKSQFERKRTQLGYRKAKHFIQRKARAASLPALRFKFLWGE
jgi:hypothetical protein